jgi:predicted branched-subunit amino acid permease
MSKDHDESARAPFVSRAGFNLGARLALPVLPGMIAFGLAVGATAARKGLSFLDNFFMNLFVYAGMSQIVAMEAWPERFGVVALASLALLCITVNARMLLMSASLQPWLGALPAWQIYPGLHILTDPSWLISMSYRARGGSDAGVFFGASAIAALAWMSAITIGYLAGALIADPRRYGIDLVMPIFFAAMLVPLWRGGRRSIAWLIAGAVALIVQQFIGGWWFMVIGALAGAVAGGFLDEP